MSTFITGVALGITGTVAPIYLTAIAYVHVVMTFLELAR